MKSLLGCLLVCTASIAPARAQNLDARCIPELARSIAYDGAQGDWFGRAVAISRNRQAVGAPHQSGAGLHAGSVYLFRAVGDQWAFEAKVSGSQIQAGDRFGESVDLEGQTLVVGAPLSDVGAGDGGAVYVFERTSGGWNEVAVLVPSDVNQGQEFGRAVALDGDDLVVGSPADDDLGPASGSAYVFTRKAGVWQEQAKLLSPTGSVVDLFGGDVDLDAGTVVVGAKNAQGGAAQAGAADVFVRSGSTWNHEAQLFAAGGVAGDDFGIAVAVQGDQVAAGARSAAGLQPTSGAVYAFERSAGQWQETQKLEATDGKAFDEFGHELSLDGGNLAVGAFGVEFDSGAVYLYAFESGAWIEATKISASDSAFDDAFGWAVDLDEGWIGVGAWRKDMPLPESGAAYVFHIAEEPIVYCSSKASAIGCAPTIHFTGRASATLDSGFVVIADNVDNQTSGILLYSVLGRGLIPFQGGLICSEIPLNRTRPVGSGGNPPPSSDCTGQLLIDMNAFASGSLPGNPIHELTEPGMLVTCQWWSRDTSPAGDHGLSNALEYTVCP